MRQTPRMPDSLDDDWLLETWQRKRPSLLARVTCVLEAVSASAPDDAGTQAVRSASHELAGTVGMFDLPQARALSIELDDQVCTGALDHPEGRIRVRQLADRLRQALEDGL
jgi:hypothetical protein